MVTLDLADALTFTEGSGLTVIDGVVGDLGLGALTDDNLVEKALELVSRRAAVRLAKRIPVGAGLGGGSADAAAVLRWAGVTSHAVAAQLGSDVPFCLAGGRARVDRRRRACRRTSVRGPTLRPVAASDIRGHGSGLQGLGLPTATGRAVLGRQPDPGNDLEEAALIVAPQLRHWRETFAGITGRRPRLAGSGSAWFVEGTPEELDLGKRTSLVLGNQRAPLVAARTTKAVLPAAGVTS